MKRMWSAISGGDISPHTIDILVDIWVNINKPISDYSVKPISDYSVSSNKSTQ